MYARFRTHVLWMIPLFGIGLWFAVGVGRGQPTKQPSGLDAKDGKDVKPAEAGKSTQPNNEKPVDVDKTFNDGQRAIDVSTDREAKFKKLCDDFAKSIENGPRAPLNLKQEKIAWDGVDQLLELLSQDCEILIRQLPKFKDEHDLLLNAYDSSISGLQQCAKILDADSQKEKEDNRKEDYLMLARISRKCAERLATRAKEASAKKIEVEKLVKEAEKDRVYFARAIQVVKLVKQPLEREMVADEFLKRIQRYQQHREQFRKIMREWSDHLDQTPLSPPTKVSSGSRNATELELKGNREVQLASR